MSLHQPAPSALLWTASTDDGRNVSKAITISFCNGKKKKCHSHELFISNELKKLCECVFLSSVLPLWHFFFLMSSDELQRLLSAIKSLISTSNLMSFHCTAVADRFRLRVWFANISLLSQRCTLKFNRKI